MANPTLMLILRKDTISSGARLRLPAVDRGRIVYALTGAVSLTSGSEEAELEPNQAWFGPGPLDIAAGLAECVMFRFEALGDSEHGNGELTPGEGVRSRLELQAQITLPADEVLMRCDRVDFPPGGVAYTHVHRGPGIRCLLHGEITVTVEGKSKTIGPLGSWFEAGPDPVFAAASKTVPTAFVRVMILPAEIHGKSSITYVKDEDRDKPRLQTYTVFIDQILSHSLQLS